METQTDNIIDLNKNKEEDESERIAKLLEALHVNRKESQNFVSKTSESLSKDLAELRSFLGSSKSLLNIKDDNDTLIFSLENTLRNIQRSIGSLVSFQEAHNSITDMLINDIQGMVMQLQQLGQNSWTSNAHLQTLLTLLEQKKVISDEEMKNTWDVISKASK